MPTTKKTIDVNGEELEISIDFEVFCSECGGGICRDTDYIRKTDNNFSTFCRKCRKEKESLETDLLEKSRENESLNNEILTLKEIIERLEDTVYNLQN